MIEVHHISKSYGTRKQKVLAVDDVSFSVNRGEIFGLIGPDGAGKTTLFRILTTLLLADSGSATVEKMDCVRDMPAIRKTIGYMPGKFSLYPDLSVEENLNFFASVFQTSVAGNYELIQEIYRQLEPFKTRRAGQLSGGMKQKLALCCALIHQPKVLFLDEPTTGVDPVSRKEFWEMLANLKKKNITILVATPYMDEASLCDRIALLQSGKILKIATPKEISESYPEDLYEIKTSGKMYTLLAALREFPAGKGAFGFGESVHLSIEKNAHKIPETLQNFLTEKGFDEIEIRQIPASVEDRFIQLLH